MKSAIWLVGMQWLDHVAWGITMDPAHLQCNNLKRFSLFFGLSFCCRFTVNNLLFTLVGSAVSYYTGDEPLYVMVLLQLMVSGKL